MHNPEPVGAGHNGSSALPGLADWSTLGGELSWVPRAPSASWHKGCHAPGGCPPAQAWGSGPWKGEVPGHSRFMWPQGRKGT